jgi:hypothetical protein
LPYSPLSPFSPLVKLFSKVDGENGIDTPHSSRFGTQFGSASALIKVDKKTEKTASLWKNTAFGMAA